MYLKSLTIATIVFLLAACGSKMMLFSQADADRGAVKFPGLTVSSLNTGKLNYETHCQTCHGLISPKAKTEQAWRIMVPKMVTMANKKSPMMAIDSAKQASILQYVVTMSTAPAN